MKKPRSEKPFPQSEPLTYRTGSLAAETQERSVVCDGAVCLPTDQDSTRLCLSTTDALSCSSVLQNGGCACASLPRPPMALPLGSYGGRFPGAGGPGPATVLGSLPRGGRGREAGAGAGARSVPGAGGAAADDVWASCAGRVPFVVIPRIKIP